MGVSFSLGETQRPQGMHIVLAAAVVTCLSYYVYQSIVTELVGMCVCVCPRLDGFLMRPVRAYKDHSDFTRFFHGA